MSEDSRADGPVNDEMRQGPVRSEMRRDTMEDMAGEASGLDRRRFLQVMSGGITVFFTVGLPGGSAMLTGDGKPRYQSRYPSDFNAYLRVGEDDRVTLLTGKIEMGQGAATALPLILAEEMDVSVDSVDIILGDTALCPWDVGTFGSLTIRMFGPALRRASAEARAVLMELAAEELGLPADRLIVDDGVVMDIRDAERSVSYGALARGRRIERHLEGEPELKPPATYTVCGEPRKRREAREKVTGEAKYAGDIRPEGMLHASLLRPPAHGARLLELDTSAASRVEGAQVIQEGDLVAVLHEKPDLAARALELVEARWEEPSGGPTHETIFRHLDAVAPDPEVYVETGSLEQGRRQARHVVESTFYNHYVAHAPMEPHAAVAQVEGDRATVWASTQAPFGVQRDVARTLDLPRENVRVITPWVGGGFGGKTGGGQVAEAARLARLAGRPVQVAWTRKEEVFHDTYRPAALVKLNAGLDADHRIVLWDYDNYFAGTRSSEVKYDVPHVRVLSRAGWREDHPAHPFAVGAWRGPASNTNVFAMESQVDILAEAAGMDPLEFRLHNLGDQRMRRVLQAAANAFGHAFEKGPSGKGYGLALTDYHGTYVAAAAEVAVDADDGSIQVKRVVVAQNMGEIVNPAGARLQVEGCVTMGLGYTLAEALRFQGGKILDENFGTYTLPRLSWTPAIEVVLVENPEVPAKGCGEPAITVMGAVLANAVYDASGARLYTLPMTPERVRGALGE